MKHRPYHKYSGTAGVGTGGHIDLYLFENGGAVNAQRYLHKIQRAIVLLYTEAEGR